MKNIKKFICKLLVASLILNLVPSTSAMAASKIKLNKSKITIKVGQSKKIKIVGANKTNKKTKWKTSNKKIVKMSAVKNDSVKITAVREGKAQITAQIGSKKYSCKITVKKVVATKQDGSDSTMDKPTSVATVVPTSVPTIEPTSVATVEPTSVATVVPTSVATVVPTSVPTIEPTSVPTVEPTYSTEYEMAAYGIDAMYKYSEYPSTLHLRYTSYEGKQYTPGGWLIERMTIKANQIGESGNVYAVVIRCDSNEHYPNAVQDSKGKYINVSVYSSNPSLSTATMLDNSKVILAYQHYFNTQKSIEYD